RPLRDGHNADAAGRGRTSFLRSAVWHSPLTTRSLLRTAGDQGLIRRRSRAAESSSADPTRIRARKAFCLLAAMATARLVLRRIDTALTLFIVLLRNNGPIVRPAQPSSAPPAARISRRDR